MFEAEQARLLVDQMEKFISRTKALAEDELAQIHASLDDPIKIAAIEALGNRQTLLELTEMVNVLSKTVLTMLKDKIAQEDLGIDP